MLPLLFSLLLFLQVPEQAKHQAEHSATLRYETGESVCSATAIGPNVILTAEHCKPTRQNGEGNPLLKLNGVDYVLIDAAADHHDHVMAVVDGPSFKDYATFNSKQLEQGDKIHLWGEPDGLVDQFRSGYVSGKVQADGEEYTLMDFNGYFGDSGAAVFGEDGKIKGVVSVIHFTDDKLLKFMGALSLQFPDAFYDEVKHIHCENHQCSKD